MNTTTERKPAGVAETPTQAGEIRARWVWVEPAVWTDRMLTALENGVKGGKWFSLIDKVWKLENLESGWERVRRNKGSGGSDGQTIHKFERRKSEEIGYLSEELKTGMYQPRPIRRHWIPKPGERRQRPLGIPTIRDRVAQTALRNVLEPIFERDFSDTSYGFRPGRGCHGALREVDALLKAGYGWVVDADLRSYFDSIPHDRLMKEVEKKIADGRVLELIRRYLKQDIMEPMRNWSPESGTPQGAVISPLLANIYLDPLDHRMKAQGYRMIRYADDFVILCRNETEARNALESVKAWVEEFGLTLHPEKTKIVNAMEKGGFDFLGFHFERGMKWPRCKSKKKFRDTIRNLTKRTNGNSLPTIISKLNPVMRGWFAYFKTGHHTTFRPLDSWVRMRLRSILRNRIKLRGRGRGRDHQRWPNDFFAKHGLFSLTTAYEKVCQP